MEARIGPRLCAVAGCGLSTRYRPGKGWERLCNGHVQRARRLRRGQGVRYHMADPVHRPCADPSHVAGGPQGVPSEARQTT